MHTGGCGECIQVDAEFTYFTSTQVQMITSTRVQILTLKAEFTQVDALFTCFTSTTVQILASTKVQLLMLTRACHLHYSCKSENTDANASLPLALLVQKYNY